jgi:hypothetical protein
VECFHRQLQFFKPFVIVDCFVEGLVDFFSLLQDNEEYCSAGNCEHLLCHTSVRGKKAERVGNRLCVHTVSGTASDMSGSLICNGDNRPMCVLRVAKALVMAAVSGFIT